MRNTFLIIAGLLFIGATMAYAVPEVQYSMAHLQGITNQAATKACIFPSGGWTIIDCSNSAAASSSALNQWSRYVIQCGDDSYFATGTAASGQDADTSDGWVPAGGWLEFMTTESIKYVSVRNKNSDSDCRILECQ